MLAGTPWRFWALLLLLLLWSKYAGTSIWFVGLGPGTYEEEAGRFGEQNGFCTVFVAPNTIGLFEDIAHLAVQGEGS